MFNFKFWKMFKKPIETIHHQIDEQSFEKIEELQKENETLKLKIKKMEEQVKISVDEFEKIEKNHQETYNGHQEIKEEKIDITYSSEDQTNLENYTNLINRCLVEGDESIGHMTELIFLVSDSSNEVERSMNFLIDTITEIYTIVKTIEDISNQSKLISLNATIEADRGDGARTFKVIASEIRNLSERTKKFTKEILSFKEKMNLESENTKEKFKDEKNTIAQIVEQIEKTASSFQNMATTVMELTDFVQQLTIKLTEMEHYIQQKEDTIFLLKKEKIELKDSYQNMSNRYKVVLKHLMEIVEINESRTFIKEE